MDMLVLVPANRIELAGGLRISPISGTGVGAGAGVGVGVGTGVSVGSRETHVPLKPMLLPPTGTKSPNSIVCPSGCLCVTRAEPNDAILYPKMNPPGRLQVNRWSKAADWE